jgi:hypothetical protein
MGPSPEIVEAVARRAASDDIVAFLAQGKACGWCRHPVRLKGSRVAVDNNTGVLSAVFDSSSCPDGVVLKACGNRRETRCPSCAAVYREDARHLVKAGLEGGKGVPDSIRDHPAILLTLTAPSFGAVHVARGSAVPCRPDNPKRRCPHGRPQGCFAHHDHADEAPGTPLCPACYRYDEAVLHNAMVPELWRRTSIYIPRRLAALLGLTQAECRRRYRVSYVRAAEFQRRGAADSTFSVDAVPVGGNPPGISCPVSVDGGCRIPIGRLEEVCVRTQRQVRVGVTKPPRDSPNSHAGAGQCGGREMSEGMERDVRHAEPVGEIAEGTGDAVGTVGL